MVSASVRNWRLALFHLLSRLHHLGHIGDMHENSVDDAIRIPRWQVNEIQK